MKLLLLIILTFPYSCLSKNNSMPTVKKISEKDHQKYLTRIKDLGPDYTPRTQHLDKNGEALYVNSLIHEESPYLLQHAHNPVNWYSWSPLAFELAVKHNKPIFLSIGYATCHWCHVMEHESFENIEIARYINKNFIAIKVDRERRSAIDSYYMTGVQIMTGYGGWPMSNFLTPQGKPFFGGTYYKPQQFMATLSRVNKTWKQQENDLRQQAIQMDLTIINRLSKTEKAKKINDSIIQNTTDYLLSLFDDLHGGFSSAPKFPQEPWLLYLLSQNSDNIDQALKHTLEKMQQGGIHDQISGGFHRYTIDNDWLTPHFEKMLYNQSQLGEVYTLAAVKYNDPEFKRTATAIFDYVLKDMKSKEQVFFSASDADSEGKEGHFYTWRYEELKQVLAADDFKWLQAVYGFSSIGNFENRNLLNLSKPLKLSARHSQTSYPKFIKKLDRINTELFIHRQKRVAPLIDNKTITSWNAQMIYSLASAYQLFGYNRYLESAKTALHYLLVNHKNNSGALIRNSLNGKASTIHAELEDYAWMISACIKLYDVTENQHWISEAHQLILKTELLFLDNDKGGFFDNIPEKNIPITNRIKKSEDGATASANGQLLIALSRYYRRTGDLHVETLFSDSLAAFSGKIVNNPVAYTSMLRALEIYQKGEISNAVYAGKGHVRIKAHRSQTQVVISLSIDDKWHINSNKTSIESLVPLSLSSDRALKFTYPQPTITKLDFSTQDLSTFEGSFNLTSNTRPNEKSPISVTLKLQACSDTICLAPEEITVTAYNTP